MADADRYDRLAQVVQGERLPAAVVDLDAVDANVDRLLAPVRAAGKTLRIASKSIRCVALLQHIQARAPDLLRGIMCFSADEARFLSGQGFDDLMLAYPTVQAVDLELLAQLNRGGKGLVSVVVDDFEQVEPLARTARERQAEVPVVIEVDASYRPFGAHVHLGVRRSPLFTAQDALRLADQIRTTDGVRLHGVMMYEAVIAGLGDANPFTRVTNPVKASLRRRARRPIAELRRRVRAELEGAGFELTVVNGGGTGSLEWASEEDALTEVTAGSGFLDSLLFDYYRGLDLQPALFFGLQVTRRPSSKLVTCHGGGYVASGESGPDRLPRPWLPRGLELLPLEGAGEVQTPLVVPAGLELKLGDPVFFRPAKAGELAEHFDTYLLCRGDAVMERAPTYRGAGQRSL